MRFEGKLYRALNPVFARAPLSGEGAALNGGRFNPKGTPALYTSLSVLTALREANQVGSLQPITLVSYDADIARVFDASDQAAMKAESMDADALADSGWRDVMIKEGEAKTQAFARRLIKAGYHGLRVRSFTKGARADDFNLVLWRWGDAPPAKLTLIDDENRLSQ